eukprot:Selendium_serpulae@DN4097_c0_g1_i3.p1
MIIPFILPGSIVCALLQVALFTAMYILYSGFRFVGRSFLSFQWDILLLEVGCVSILSSVGVACSLLTSGGHAPVLTTLCLSNFRILVVKLMFCAGICKYSSGCPEWRCNTAMDFHFWTQPIPSPVSWYVHWKSPKTLQCVGTAVVEIVFPFFIFFTDMMRGLAATTFIGLMTVIWFTGNFGFFNFLTSAISLSLFDDRFLGYGLPPKSPSGIGNIKSPTLGLLVDLLHLSVLPVVAAITMVYVSANLGPLVKVWRRPSLNPPPTSLRHFHDLSGLMACNSYGLFANMTVFRHELIFEEMHMINGKEVWIEVAFRYKPGDINRRCPWLWWCHMPRLDWVLWFIPLRISRTSAISWPDYWPNLLSKLAAREASLLRLLGPQKVDLTVLQSPTISRVSLFEYQFSRPSGVQWAPPVKGQPSEDTTDFEGDDWERGIYWQRRHLGVVEEMCCSSSPSSRSSRSR